MSATRIEATGAIEAAREFFAAYNAHDVDQMIAACAADAQLRYVPMGRHGQGKIRELGKAIWSGFIDTFPDLHVTVQSIFGDGRDVAAEVMIGGTQRKDLLYGQVRIPGQGKHYELPHAFLLKRDDGGLITEIASYWDNASFFAQLGKTTLE